MKIAVLFDGASALGKTPDLLILETVEAVEVALAAEGNEVVRLPVNPDGRWVERVRKGKFDLAFNLCEGIDGVAELEPSVIAVLEMLHVPYTGSSSWTTAMCLRKHLVNAMLDRAGLPVPRWALVRRGDTLPVVGFPAIVKPACEDASIGVEQRSVVRTVKALSDRVNAMLETWDDVIVQRYVDGREVNVGIVANEMLPIAEIDFAGMPKGMWRIVTYRSKWQEGSDEDLGAKPRCPAELSSEMAGELRRIAAAAWSAVGGQGYGRCDFRIDRNGRPWLLEVNSNPDFSPDAGLARMGRVAGYDYATLVRMIAQEAVGRRRLTGTEGWAEAQLLSGMGGNTDPAVLDLFAVGQQ
jgi:D-alanine-D-alanine ligase